VLASQQAVDPDHCTHLAENGRIFSTKGLIRSSHSPDGVWDWLGSLVKGSRVAGATAGGQAAMYRLGGLTVSHCQLAQLHRVREMRAGVKPYMASASCCAGMQVCGGQATDNFA
jgi:hypothetical protein